MMLTTLADSVGGNNAFITELSNDLTASSFWLELQTAAPFIATLVVFAFGYRVIRKVISGAAKGRAKI